jgi:hypothetical protein
LLGLGEEVVRVAVQRHAADDAQRHQLFRHDLRGVEDVERKRLGLRFGNDLQREVVLRVMARLDRFPQIAAVEVGVGAVDLHRFVPHQRVRAGHRQPVELDEVRLALVVDETVRVHAEAGHRAVAARDAAVAHHPQRVVDALRHQRHEIPERVVRARRLRHAVVRLGLDRVDQIRELHRVLDEEHRDVVADEIPVAFVGIELDGEAARVAHRVGAATFAGHGGKAHEHRRLLAR